MTCINRETIQRYIDNEVKNSEKYIIEAHINICNRCASEVKRADTLKNSINNALNNNLNKDIEIPDFKIPETEVKRTAFILKKVLYAAAVIMVITSLSVVVLVNNNNANVVIPETNTIQNIEYDANKSIFDTEITVIVTDNEGNSTAYSIE